MDSRLILHDKAGKVPKNVSQTLTKLPRHVRQCFHKRNSGYGSFSFCPIKFTADETFGKSILTGIRL